MSGSKIYYDDTAGRYRVEGVSEEDEDALWTSLVEVLSDPHHAGEMYTSAAPYDPTFWVIHPTAERLLNAKRIAVALHGEVFDETWSYDHVHKAASDTGQVRPATHSTAFGMKGSRAQPCHSLRRGTGENAHALLTRGDCGCVCGWCAGVRVV